MEIEDTLKEIGLTDEEIKTYLIMLKRGSSLASKIAEETKINRSHTYQILERLIAKGFVTYVIKENRKYFTAVNPRKILELIKEKEDKLKLIIPELSKLSATSENKPVVEIFEGKEGIKTILNDILRVKKEWLALSPGISREILPYYTEHWEKERQKNKIPLKVVFDSSEHGKERGKEFLKMDYTEVKYLPMEFSGPSSTWIYGDRIALVMWSKEHPLAIRIKSEEIVKNYKNYFEALWKLSKK